MTTQRDLDTAAEVSMKICPNCGWYDGYYHAERCDVARGRAAQRLIAAVPDVPAGQLGYGERGVAFDLHAERFTIVFECREHGFSLRNLHLLQDLTEEDAAALVQALKQWRDDVQARKATP